MCADIAYNETIFPNLMGQLTQDIAGQHMSQYVPLIKGRNWLKLPRCKIYLMKFSSLLERNLKHGAA